MGFTPSSVGLSGERVTAPFRENRGGCPHKGIDISSSQRPKPFTAGVFGRIVSPIGGKWGTISVRPYVNSRRTIQYLHCSEISVRVGQRVAPWTVLGLTGATAPPGSGITGIHLHLQAAGSRSGSPDPCWGSRVFDDPASFPTPDVALGNWSRRFTKVSGSFLVNTLTNISMGGSAIGSPVAINQLAILQRSDGCQWRFPARWIGIVKKHGSDNKFYVETDNGSCSSSHACGQTPRCGTQSWSSWVQIDSTSKLVWKKFANEGSFKRSLFEEEDKHFESTIIGAVEEGCSDLADSDTSIIVMQDGGRPDFEAIEALTSGMSEDEYFGVVSGEQF